MSESGEPLEYFDYSPHEQSLLHLMSCVNGSYKSDYLGMHKTNSIRFTVETYPMVKALAEMSGNSINIIVNQMIKVAHGVLGENLKPEELEELQQKESEIYRDWMNEYQLPEGEK